MDQDKRLRHPRAKAGKLIDAAWLTVDIAVDEHPLRTKESLPAPGVGQLEEHAVKPAVLKKERRRNDNN